MYHQNGLTFSKKKEVFGDLPTPDKIIIHKTVYLHDTTNNNDNNINSSNNNINNNIIIRNPFYYHWDAG